MIDDQLPKMDVSELRVRTPIASQDRKNTLALYSASPLRKSAAHRRARAHRKNARQTVNDIPRPWVRDTLKKCGICTAILLALLAVKQLDWPVAQKTTETVKAAVTMDMDISQSLGKLQFVRNIFPESAQVFWDFSEEGQRFLLPMDGVVAKTYSQNHPGIELRGGTGLVAAAADGEIIEIRAEPGGSQQVRIRHESAIESIYGYLSAVTVAEGEKVKAGDAIGHALASDGEPRLFFEVTRYTRPFDPNEVLVNEAET